jgi:phosphoglycerate kinase
MSLKMNRLDDFDYRGKTVLLRVDINSPIDLETKKIANDNRIQKSIPTIKKLILKGAKVAMIAHQGDTLDYQNLIPLSEHAGRLTELLGVKVDYIDDVAGPAAIEKIEGLKSGEIVLLGNLRYLTEEISTFENAVKLKPEEMLETYLVRRLRPYVDFYVNEAFSAAHRNAPSMVAFQEFLPSAAGELMFKEISEIDKVMRNPEKPSVFCLGGAKISDAFGMMEQVLENGTADKILTSGITGEIFLIAKGYDIGETKMKFLRDRNLLEFVEPAKKYLELYEDKIEFPIDLAFAQDGKREEMAISDLPAEEMFMDIGTETLKKYDEILHDAKTIFVNGPAGVYEDTLFEKGTHALWLSIAHSPGHSVIGGGDTVSAAARFIDLKDVGYVCTAGGAMVRYLSGKQLPLIESMEKAYMEEVYKKVVNQN